MDRRHFLGSRIDDWNHINWSSRRVMPILCLPSTGHWGDIGYVVFGM